MTAFNPSRRNVVLGGTVLTAGCFAGLELRSLLAFAQEKGLPLLTRVNLNTAIAEAAAGSAYAAFLRDAAGNLAEFLDRRFALTEHQRREIGAIPPGQLGALAAALEGAATAGRLVRADSQWNKVQPPAPGPGLAAADAAGGGPPAAPAAIDTELTITAREGADALLIDVVEVPAP